MQKTKWWRASPLQVRLCALQTPRGFQRSTILSIQESSSSVPQIHVQCSTGSQLIYWFSASTHWSAIPHILLGTWHLVYWYTWTWSARLFHPLDHLVCWTTWPSKILVLFNSDTGRPCPPLGFSAFHSELNHAVLRPKIPWFLDTRCNLV